MISEVRKMKSILKKTVALILISVFIFIIFSSCSVFGDNNGDEKMKIGVLSGPTGMGMAKLMETVKSDPSLPYEFTLYASPDTAVTDFLTGTLDAVCLPSNTAAMLYSKQNDKVRVLAVNCLSSLFVVAKKELGVSDMNDLSGKTVTVSVPTSTTGPVIEYLKSALSIDFSVETVSTHDALVADLMKGSVDIAVLPEPKVTSVLLQSDAYEVAFPIGDVWHEVTDTDLPMGCLVVKADYIEENPDLIETFMSDFEESVSYIGNPDNLDSAAGLIVGAGVLPNKNVAERALTNLDGAIVFRSGSVMKNDLTAFYEILYEKLPATIGNDLPKDEIYYEIQKN